MLTIIHGADTALSRKYFLDEKGKYANSLLLDADKVNLTDLTQIFEGGGLFGETKFVFIEQFLTKRKKSADFKDIITYLEKSADDNTILLWENKELEISILKAFKHPIIKAFKLPQTLFQLLDEIKPGNGKQLITLFHQTIESTEIEMVFFMIVRQIRLMLALSTTVILNEVKNPPTRSFATTQDDNPIDEVKRMQPWQKTKLQKLASLFSTEQLLDLYNKIYQIEHGQKTGGLNASLVSTIDFLLLEV
ncbi:MAG: hypothetical protein ACREHC_06455 [Candidatus Levyibacteriota bacterium]